MKNTVDDTLRIKFAVNLLKTSGNFMYRRVQHSIILHSAQIAYMYFVHISEQTATFAVNISKSSFFITEVESVYCAVRSVYIKQITFRL
jgi:hypothetical protein